MARHSTPKENIQKQVVNVRYLAQQSQKHCDIFRTLKTR
jgi:hypothetical protein